MKRRHFLQLSTAAAAASLGSCNKSKAATRSLHVYTWADYLAPDVAANFEKEFSCKLVIDTFDSNESMHAKLAAGATGYDVLVPTSYMVKTLAREGLLQALDHSRLTNLSHVDPAYLKRALDPEMKHSVPYMMAPTCIAWRTDKVANPVPSYSMYTREDLKGRMTLLDDPREVLGGALRLLGFPLNSTDPAQLAAARDLVKSWKPNLAKFENEQYKSGIASGEFHVVQGYAGDLFQVQEETESIEIAIPQEGSAFSCDDLCITKAAKEPGLAHDFINFLTKPETASENMQYISYRAPNTDAYRLLPEDFRGNPVLFPDEALFAKLEPIDDLGDAQALWTKMWDEVKAS